MSRPSDKRRELETGLAGDGAKVWLVVTTWTGADGRHRQHAERFDSEAEARHWMRWA